MTKDKRLFARSVIFQFLNVFVTGGVSLVLVPLYIRNVGVERYGVLELILSFLVINLFLEFGLGSTVIKFSRTYAEKGHDEYRRFFWTYFWIKIALGFVGAIAVIGISFLFSEIFRSVPADFIAEAKTSLLLFAIGLFIANLSVYLANALKGFLRFDLAITTSVISWIALLAALLISGRRGEISLPGLSALVFIFRPAVQFVVAIVSFKYAVSIPIRPARPSREVLLHTIRFMGGFSAITLVAQAFNRLPKMILGVFTGPLSLAFFGVLEKLREPVIQIQDSILRPLIPVVRKEQIENSEVLTEIIRRVVSIQSVVCAVAMAAVLFSRPFILLWLGDEFARVADVARIWFIPFLLPNAGALTMVYYSSGKTKLSLIFVIITTLIGLGAGTALAMAIGWQGMVYGIVGATCVISIARLIVFSRELSVRMSTAVIPYLKNYVVLVPLAILYVVVRGDTLVQNWGRLLFACVFFVLAYAGVAGAILFRREISSIIQELRGTRSATA